MEPAEAPRRALFARPVLLILAVALLVRIGFVLLTRHLQLTNDPLDYQRLAIYVSHGHGFGTSPLAAGGGAYAVRPPLYPIALGALYAIIGVHVVAARLIQAVVGTGAVALLYVLADRLFGRRVALVTAAVAAVYPPFLLAGGSLLTEVLYLPLELAALIAALYARANPRATRWLVAAGVFAGLTTLSRSIGLIVIASAAALVWVGRPRWSWRALRAPLIVGLAGAAVVAPWTIRNEVRMHQFVIVSDEDAFILAGNYNDTTRHDPQNPNVWRPPNFIPQYEPLFADRSLDESKLARKLRASGLRYARNNPSYVAELYAHNLLRLYSLHGFYYSRQGNRTIGYSNRVSDVASVTFWLVGAAAVAGAFLKRARQAPVALWLLPILATVITPFALPDTRYRIPIEPFVVMLAAIAVVAAFERRRVASS